MRPRRWATILVGLGAMAGCGADVPSGATEAEFCEAFTEPGLTSDDFSEVQAWAVDVREVGTPEEMPEDARAGLLTTLDAIDAAGDLAELDAADEDFDAEQERQVEEMFAYVEETCS